MLNIINANLISDPKCYNVYILYVRTCDDNDVFETSDHDAML